MRKDYFYGRVRGYATPSSNKGFRGSNLNYSVNYMGPNCVIPVGCFMRGEFAIPLKFHTYSSVSNPSAYPRIAHGFRLYLKLFIRAKNYFPIKSSNETRDLCFSKSGGAQQ